MLLTEASLSDSYMFGEINKSAMSSKKILTALRSGSRLDASYIQEQLIQIKKSRISPLCDNVLQAFSKKEIVLLYNKSVLVGKSIPFVCMNEAGKPTSFIFIADFSGVSEDGASLTIDMKKLYVLMEAAFICREYYSEPWKFQRSPVLLKTLATIYSGMFMRLLNKEFSLSLDKNLYDSVNFSIAKFYLEKVAEIPNKDLVASYAMKTCVNPSKAYIDDANRKYDAVTINNVSDLIKFISTLSPKMENLTFKYFFERWIATFGTGAFLSLDTIPYLIYVINNVLLGGFLVNVVSLSEMIKNTKGINLYYPELSKII